MTKPDSGWALSAFAGPQASPGFVLWRDFMQWQRGLNAVLKPVGLTQPQFAILAVCGWLTRDEKVVTQQDIARFLGLDRMHVSQIAARLENDGLMDRSILASDLRTKRVILTPIGQARLARAMPLVERYDASFFAQRASDTSARPTAP